MRLVANSRPAEGIAREDVVQYFADHGIESSTWDLFRHRIVTEYLFKVGPRPGVLLFLDVESEEAAAEILNALPVVSHGILVFDIDQVSALAHF